MRNPINPGESLETRLGYGGSVPDQELLDRAASCAAWFKDNPEQRLLWMPRLRRAKKCPMTAPLWEEIEPIVELDVH